MPVETSLKVYRRYLQLEPSHAEEAIAYMKKKVGKDKQKNKSSICLALVHV